MSRHILHVTAEIDVLLTGVAEAYGWLIGLLEVLPELRALETKLNWAVGDGGHGDWETGRLLEFMLKAVR